MKQNNGKSVIQLIYLIVVIITISALFKFKIDERKFIEDNKQFNIEQSVINKALAATVSIQARSNNNKSSSGSGFFISPDGIILTNEHVINNADLIYVTDCTGKCLKADIVASDKRLDIAIIKIQPESCCEFLEFGNTSNLGYSELVIASGNPLNNASDGRAVITMGRISKLNERFNISPDFTNDRFYDNLIQFDASVFPGSSGGPLLNKNGNAIGVIVAISKDEYSVQNGFAINADDYLKNAIDILMSGKQIEYGFLGTILADEIPIDIVDKYNLVNLSGAYVDSVLPGSPGGNAEIFTGDIITKVCGKTVHNRTELISIVNKTKPGSVLDISLIRPLQNNTKNITVSAKIEKRTLTNRNGYFNEIKTSQSHNWGITVKSISDWRRKKDFIPDNINGLLVYNVEPDSLASRQGIKPGDVITQIENIPVNDLHEFDQITSQCVFSPKFTIWKPNHLRLSSGQ